MFSLFNFLSIFPGGSADRICPYVQTPMGVAPTAACTLRLQFAHFYGISPVLHAMSSPFLIERRRGGGGRGAVQHGTARWVVRLSTGLSVGPMAPMTDQDNPTIPRARPRRRDEGRWSDTHRRATTRFEIHALKRQRKRTNDNYRLNV